MAQALFEEADSSVLVVPELVATEPDNSSILDGSPEHQDLDTEPTDLTKLELAARARAAMILAEQGAAEVAARLDDEISRIAAELEPMGADRLEQVAFMAREGGPMRPELAAKIRTALTDKVPALQRTHIVDSMPHNDL